MPTATRTAAAKAKAAAPQAKAPEPVAYKGTFHAAHGCESGHSCNCIGIDPGHPCSEESLQKVRGIAPHHRHEPIDPESVPAEFRADG